MNITEYLTNPMGKGSSVVPNAQVKDKLNMEFSGMRLAIKCFQYLLADHWMIYHVQIPSSHQAGVIYDVVLEFDKNDADAYGINRIDFLPFRCYSNCPSFMYTYAKVFYDKGLLIDWMTDKYEKETTTVESKQRNTYGLISYERSLYLACKYLMNGNRNMVEYFVTHSVSFHTPEEIKKMIQSGKQVMNKYEHQKSLQKQMAIKEEAVEKKKKDTEKKDSKKLGTKSIGKVNKPKGIKKISRIKKI